MKKRLTTATLAASLLSGSAHAGDLTEQVKIYAPINAIASPCALRATDRDANNAMLAGIKSDPEAAKLLARLHNETQASYRAATDTYRWCEEFAAKEQSIRHQDWH